MDNMVRSNTYIDICAFSLKCVSEYSKFKDASERLIRVVTTDHPDIGDHFLAIVRSVESRDSDDAKESFFYFFNATCEGVLAYLSSVTELDAFSDIIKVGHTLYDCDYSERGCRWNDPTHVRNLVAIKYAESISRRKLQRLERKLAEGQVGVIKSIKFSNLDVFLDGLIEDVNSGTFFEQKLYNRELEVDDKFNVRWGDKVTSESKAENVSSDDFDWDNISFHEV